MDRGQSVVIEGLPSIARKSSYSSGPLNAGEKAATVTSRTATNFHGIIRSRSDSGAAVAGAARGAGTTGFDFDFRWDLDMAGSIEGGYT